jgi:hypothetical protein
MGNVDICMYFMDIWSILPAIWYMQFAVILSIFPVLVCYTEKIWQPWFQATQSIAGFVLVSRGRFMRQTKFPIRPTCRNFAYFPWRRGSGAIVIAPT